MKYSKYIIIFISAVILGSCQKEEVLAPKFDVSTEIPFWSGKYSVKVNDPVKFLIDGNADFITFYSGESGKEYQYRDRTVLPNGVSTTRDKGSAIKGFSENSLSSFNYPYLSAGTFTATFVAINRTQYGEEKVIVINVPVLVTL
jgi:hypothetical protein